MRNVEKFVEKLNRFSSEAMKAGAACFVLIIALYIIIAILEK